MASFTTDNFIFIDFTDMDETLSHQAFECRNLYEIRKNMDNPAPIAWRDHIAFVKSLEDLSNKLYFCILSKAKEFIGSVNLHFESSESAERGIYLHPYYQGKGLSKKISKEFYIYCRDILGLCYITTKVKKDNEASNALQRSVGASKIGEDEVYYYYLCGLK